MTDNEYRIWIESGRVARGFIEDCTQESLQRLWDSLDTPIFPGEQTPEWRQVLDGCFIGRGHDGDFRTGIAGPGTVVLDNWNELQRKIRHGEPV